MAANWQIFDVKSQIADGLVTNVTYGCTAQLDNYIDRRVGELSLEGSADEPNFIPYSDLTETEIIGWVKSILGNTTVNSIETSLNNSVTAQKAAAEAQTTKSGLPWRN